jgi:hypothetical protein
MRDGTYLKTAGTFQRIEAVDGYWVATAETTLETAEEGEIIGVWSDPETGKLWVDKTRFIQDLATATITAKAYDQIAIWDNANQTTISTN